MLLLSSSACGGKIGGVPHSLLAGLGEGNCPQGISACALSLQCFDAVGWAAGGRKGIRPVKN